MTTEVQHRRRTKFHLPLRSEDALRKFLWRAFRVRIPDVQVCPHHTTPWRAFYDAYTAKNPVAVWKASRGFGGKTFTLGSLGLVSAITQAADVTILGGSGVQSERVHESMNTLWGCRYSPRNLLTSDPAKRATKLSVGSSITALTASTKAARGPHPQRLLMDEVDEMDRVVMTAAMGQTMRRTGRFGPIETATVLSSTHQYVNGTMTYVLDRLAPEKGWPIYEWCYRESLAPHGWLEQSEVERKQSEVTKQMWETEYDLQRPVALGEAAFACFKRGLHTKRLTYESNLPVYLGIDYGISTFAWIAFQVLPASREVHIIGADQYHDLVTWRALEETRSAELLNGDGPCISTVKSNGKDPKFLVTTIGCDPGAQARDEHTGRTSIDLTKKMFPGVQVKYSNVPQHKNPSWRAEQIRALLDPADGRTRLFVDDRLADAISMFELSVNRNDEPWKDGVWEHLRDALGFGLVNAGVIRITARARAVTVEGF